MRTIEEICNDIKKLTSRYMWMAGGESYQRDCLLQEIIDTVKIGFYVKIDYQAKQTVFIMMI